MNEYRAFLKQTQNNLNILLEREAKFAGNQPLELLAKIDDHRLAVTLTEQAIAGDLSKADWREAMRPLLVVVKDNEGLSATPVPLQRPPRAEHFMGRDRQLKDLLASLQPGKVVTLCGPGGIGKSALAAEVD